MVATTQEGGGVLSWQAATIAVRAARSPVGMLRSKTFNEHCKSRSGAR